MITNWSNAADSLSLHKNYLIQLATLEALLMHGSQRINDLALVVAKRMRGNEVVSSTTGQYLIDRLVYLERLGFVTIENDIVKLTDEGTNALKTGYFQNIVSTTYFNLKSINFSITSIIVSLLAIIVSIIAPLKG